jgi:hypothetical protein
MRAATFSPLRSARLATKAIDGRQQQRTVDQHARAKHAAQHLGAGPALRDAVAGGVADQPVRA